MDKDSNVPEDIKKQIFAKIAKNDVDGFKLLLAQHKGININFLDADGMSPLQHAACKGNMPIVQILLDMGADIEYHQHGANYTPLHFAALSGSTDVCRLLLDAGINPSSLNSVSRTASQMAQFVGNHACVETINSYIARSVLEYYTKPQGLQKEPLIQPSVLEQFHEFVVSSNLHPVRIVLNLQALNLLRHLPGLCKAFKLMCEKEMKKTHDVNELMAFKFHYLGWIISELMRCEEQCKAQRKEKSSGDGDAPKNDFVEMFIKRVLKENKLGQLDYVEFTIRDCVREFPFRECTIFKQIVATLAAKDAPSALIILKNAINGQRGFSDDISNCCSSCSTEKPDKKCSKCKAVQYCDRECQRLHWFMHKKTCARPITGSSANNTNKGSIDTNELREEIARMAAS